MARVGQVSGREQDATRTGYMNRGGGRRGKGVERGREDLVTFTGGTVEGLRHFI